MPLCIVGDEQRGKRSTTPLLPSGWGGEGASAALPLLGVATTVTGR